MSETLVTALVALAGSLIGALSGAMLTLYRIKQLEMKVEKHNNLIDRMYKTEKDVEILSEKVRVANHRIEDLEKDHHMGTSDMR